MEGRGVSIVHFGPTQVPWLTSATTLPAATSAVTSLGAAQSMTSRLSALQTTRNIIIYFWGFGEGLLRPPAHQQDTFVWLAAFRRPSREEPPPALRDIETALYKWLAMKSKSGASPVSAAGARLSVCRRSPAMLANPFYKCKDEIGRASSP